MSKIIPFNVQPLHPTLVQPFHQPGWVYEEKVDGWRILAYKADGKVRLVSRRGLDHTKRFPDVAKAVAALPDSTVVLDGEVAVFDERLVSRFDLLADPEPDVLITPPVYVAFDVLYAESEDWRTRPLTDRREVLEGLMENAEGIFAVRRLDNDGHKAWEEVLRRGLEGFVGKDPTSTYIRGGRTRSWLKSKVRREGHFVVGGVVNRTEGWSLLVGSPEDGKLAYRGLVHFGVGPKLVAALTTNELVRSTSPFAEKVPLKGVTWLDPRLTAEVSYAEVMRGGKLRAGVFRGFVDA